MKTLSLFAAILFSMFSINTATAQTVSTETIKVWGNCGMCKTTIEKAAKKAVAKTADWNEDSKELKVTYAVKKTSSAKIQEAIAKSGYDTQDFTAIQTAYDNLHGCCKYERKADAPKIAEPASAAVYTCPMHADVKSDNAEWILKNSKHYLIKLNNWRYRQLKVKVTCNCIYCSGFISMT